MTRSSVRPTAAFASRWALASPSIPSLIFLSTDRSNTMFLIESLLNRATTQCFINRSLKRVGHFICIEDNLSIYVSSCDPSSGSAKFTTQESFLVGIQNGHHRHFRQIETFHATSSRRLTHQTYLLAIPSITPLVQRHPIPNATI